MSHAGRCRFDPSRPLRDFFLGRVWKTSDVSPPDFPGDFRTTLGDQKVVSEIPHGTVEG